MTTLNFLSSMVSANFQDNELFGLDGMTYSSDVKWKYYTKSFARSPVKKVHCGVLDV